MTGASVARVCFKRKCLKQRYARRINMLDDVPFAQTIDSV